MGRSNGKIAWHTETRKLSELKPAEYNPRQATEKEWKDLRTSIERFNLADPIIINKNNNVIGGHFRIKVLEEKKVEEVDVRVPNRQLTQEEERELNLRLNKNLGEWDFDMLANIDEDLLKVVGFESEELDRIFDLDPEEPEKFDLEVELARLKIDKIRTKKGTVWRLGEHRLLCGSSTSQEDLSKLVGDQKMDLCLTDPPYVLNYLQTKYKGKPSCKGSGYRANRRYLETDEAPTFDEWIPLIARLLKPNANIIIYENWKNIIPLWQEMAKYWKIKNMIIWHLPNRRQGFAAKYRFFSRYDIAMLAGNGKVLNLADEEESLQQEYETALYAIQGKPQWEPYRKGGKYCPTDVITFRANDVKHSGQGIIFGVKPTEILLPYMKVLSKRGNNVIEPFGGSGSTLITAEKLKRKCFVMELVPIYCEVIRVRWERLTGEKAVIENG